MPSELIHVMADAGLVRWRRRGSMVARTPASSRSPTRSRSCPEPMSRWLDGTDRQQQLLSRRISAASVSDGDFRRGCECDRGWIWVRAPRRGQAGPRRLPAHGTLGRGQ